MRIAFYYSEFENIGIEYLSAVLKKKGHNVQLFFDPFPNAKFMSFDKQNFFDLKRFHPELVCFSVLSDTYSWCLSKAEKIRKLLQVPIVFGGIHTTLVPEKVILNPFIDYLIIGEGEKVFPQLLQYIKNGEKFPQINNLWWRNKGSVYKGKLGDLIKNLDNLPFPDKELFYNKSSHFMKDFIVMTSRGCPYRCSFCNNTSLSDMYKKTNQQWLRRRSIENTLEELQFRKRKFFFKNVVFYDETFTYDKRWLEQFSIEYPKKIGVPYHCWGHPQTITAETATYLKESGCISIRLGIQTYSERVKQKYLYRHETNVQVISAIEHLNRVNINVIAENILGIPGQDETELIELANLYNHNRVHLLNVYGLRYYPKTPIIQIAKNHNLLTSEQIRIIEESKEVKSYLCGGDIPDKLFSKFHFLFAVLNFLPKSIINFILKNKLYYLLPRLPSLFLYSFFRWPFDKTDFVKNYARRRFWQYLKKKIKIPIANYFSMNTNLLVSNDDIS